MSISGALLGKTIGGIAVTALATFGGYNYATTGCVTGLGCSSDVEGSALLPVADGSAESGSCCSLTDDAPAAELTLVADEASGDSCCSLTEDTAAVATVADEASGDSCCSLEAEGAAGELTTVALAGEAASGDSCCSAKAEECTEEGCDKPDCCKTDG